MTKQLKIAVFHNLPSGGAKRSLYTYIDYLTKKGHIVDVFIPSTANEDYLPLKDIATNMIEYEVKPSFFREKIYSIFSYVPAIFKKVSVKNVFKAEKKIAEDINQGDYDIVYCEQDQYTMTPIILKYLTKPTIYYCQQPVRRDEILNRVNDQKPKTGIFNNPLIKPFAQYYVEYVETHAYQQDYEFAQYATNLLANSYFSHENILRQYAKNAYVSYIGVDTNKFKPMNLKRENFVLSVGTCIPPKGYDFLIKSIAHIPKEKRPELVIVGNKWFSKNIKDKYLKELKKISIPLKNKVIFTNYIDHDKINILNSIATVVVVPSIWEEPAGRVVLEAEAVGTPVIISDAGGMKEYVNENSAIVVNRDAKFIDNLAIEIHRIINDKKLQEKMGKEGLKFSKQFNSEHYYKEIMTQLLDKNYNINIKKV